MPKGAQPVEMDDVRREGCEEAAKSGEPTGAHRAPTSEHVARQARVFERGAQGAIVEKEHRDAGARALQFASNEQQQLLGTAPAGGRNDVEGVHALSLTRGARPSRPTDAGTHTIRHATSKSRRGRRGVSLSWSA